MLFRWNEKHFADLAAPGLLLLLRLILLLPSDAAFLSHKNTSLNDACTSQTFFYVLSEFKAQHILFLCALCAWVTRWRPVFSRLVHIRFLVALVIFLHPKGPRMNVLFLKFLFNFHNTFLKYSFIYLPLFQTLIFRSFWNIIICK